jgi:hypothetical protein
MEMSNRVRVEPVVPFRFGGHVALDFVNTVDSRTRPSERDYIDTFQRLIAWSRQVCLIQPAHIRNLLDAPPTIAVAAHREALALRDSLHHVFGAVIDDGVPPRDDMLALNLLLGPARGKQVLTRSAGKFHWSWTRDEDARTPALLVA